MATSRVYKVSIPALYPYVFVVGPHKHNSYSQDKAGPFGAGLADLISRQRVKLPTSVCTVM